jgi:predicted amidophosphoribosyltransferase
MLDSLAELLFPTRCAGCDLPGGLICARCAERLPLIDPATACPRCGAPTVSECCVECADVSFAFSGARCAGVLEPPLSRMVTLHKDAGERRLAPALASLALDALSGWLEWPDAICGVPASPAAVLRRGFDHGASLAASLGSLARIPAIEPLRCRPRLDQRALTREQRRANAARSIVSRRGVHVPSRVLLVDDVFTTGATLDAAACALLSGGAAEVRVVAVARACGGG